MDQRRHDEERLAPPEVVDQRAADDLKAEGQGVEGGDQAKIEGGGAQFGKKADTRRTQILHREIKGAEHGGDGDAAPGALKLRGRDGRRGGRRDGGRWRRRIGNRGKLGRGLRIGHGHGFGKPASTRHWARCTRVILVAAVMLFKVYLVWELRGGQLDTVMERAEAR